MNTEHEDDFFILLLNIVIEEDRGTQNTNTSDKKENGRQHSNKWCQRLDVDQSIKTKK